MQSFCITLPFLIFRFLFLILSRVGQQHIGTIPVNILGRAPRCYSSVAPHVVDELAFVSRNCLLKKKKRKTLEYIY